MGMTITEKILAAHAGVDSVEPGEIVDAKLDVIMCHDVTTPPAIDMLEKNGMDSVSDPDRIVVIPDHFVPNKDIASAQLNLRLRKWVKKHGIKKFYDVGRNGVCHVMLPEKGLVKPGETIICADSHTCTHGAFGAFATGVGSTDLAAAIYSGRLWFKVPSSIRVELSGELPEGVCSKDIVLELIRMIGVDGALYEVLELTGDTLPGLSMSARMTITNMAIEAGAKTGIIEPDSVTEEYLKARGVEDYEVVRSDADAQYSRTISIDVSCLEPMVAFPHLPSNGRSVTEIDEGEVEIDQAYLGSCTNGRIEDLRIAASILKGKKIAPGVRMLVVPGSTEVWKQAMSEGLLAIFADAECAVSSTTCGACLGGHMGILGEGEKCISTTNRNFTGRMGHPKSEVYLAGPATVAASAVRGFITDPRRI